MYLNTLHASLACLSAIILLRGLLFKPHYILASFYIKAMYLGDNPSSFSPCQSNITTIFSADSIYMEFAEISMYNLIYTLQTFFKWYYTALVISS